MVNIWYGPDSCGTPNKDHLLVPYDISISCKLRFFADMNRTDILILFLNQDPNLLRSFIIQQEGNTLLGLLVCFFALPEQSLFWLGVGIFQEHSYFYGQILVELSWNRCLKGLDFNVVVGLGRKFCCQTSLLHFRPSSITTKWK